METLGSSTRFNRGRRQGTSGCFKPGTKVLTLHGEVNIEDVQGGTQILTSVSSNGQEENAQYGECSDETVKQSLEGVNNRARLCGFNDKAPFFSANQVFHTTTGLRAVDPHSAAKENPWLHVGPLKPGHVLFHSANGKDYEVVEIRRFFMEDVQCASLHGIHLREGLRSYHADGYLVHANGSLV